MGCSTWQGYLQLRIAFCTNEVMCAKGVQVLKYQLVAG